MTALANLLGNAVSYSPAGGPVSVSRRLVNGLVEITVTDREVLLGKPTRFNKDNIDKFDF